jgi:hypothetical protein
MNVAFIAEAVVAQPHENSATFVMVQSNPARFRGGDSGE